MLISVYWPSLVNVYPELDIRAPLFTSTIQSQYTVIGRTAHVTSQIQEKLLTTTEIKGDKQDNKLSALINQRSN